MFACVGSGWASNGGRLPNGILAKAVKSTFMLKNEVEKNGKNVFFQKPVLSGFGVFAFFVEEQPL